MQLVLLALLALLSGARAHPGAIAEGRATCGSEYSTPQTAYRIPDIKESWFLRRVATCEAPVFWTTFDVETEGQKLYIATITPELPRFKDKHVFNAILYGPGVGPSLDGLSDVPATLPPGVSLASGIGDAAYMKSPADLTKCDFVDTNPVMEYYSDVIRERCMEKLTLDADYKDALQAGVTGFSWWIYSFNHKAGKPGRYYLQTWLSDASTGAVAQGKYEVTLGPWTWGGYATQDTQAEAQAQGTDCSCASNALAYKEMYNERLGDIEAAVYSAELPGGSCDASPKPKSACVTQARKPYMSDDSQVEWSGLFSVTAGRTYRWTFRAYYYQHGDGVTASTHYLYPDPGINVFVKPASTIAEVAAAADAALKVEDSSTLAQVTAGGTLALNSDAAQHIKFTDPSQADGAEDKRKTEVLIKPDATGTIAIFTQHVPSEFMAGHLVDVESSDYIFPTSATLYGGGKAEGVEAATTPVPSASTRLGAWSCWALATVTMALVRGCM